MKQKILTYFILVTVCIGLHSCLFKQDDYFDASSAERATADVLKCSELLKSSPNGWLMEYYIGPDYSLGGITLFCKFGEEKVKMASTLTTPNIPSGVSMESLYRIVSEQSTMLTFDSYNELIHYFGTPMGSGNDANANMGGDYEFIIMNTSNDQITLQGKKYGNTILMTRLPAETDWKEYIRNVNQIEEEAYLYQFDVIAGDQRIGELKRVNYTLAWNDKEIDSSTIPFVFTPNGFHFREPITIAGKEVQHFIWDTPSMTFTCKDEGAQNIKIVSTYPAGYLHYNDFLGNYTFKCQSMLPPTTPEEMPVPESKEIEISILQNVENESFTMTGLNAPINMTYDRTNGKMEITVQPVGTIGSYYAAISFGNNQGYIPFFQSLLTGYYFTVTSKIENTNPLVFSFEDDGTFKMLTNQDPTGIIFQGYTSGNYNSNTFNGWMAWYFDYTIEKKQ